MRSLGQVRRYHRALAGVLLALLIAGLMSVQFSTAVSADVSINIMNFKFDPTPLTIPVGTTVVWTNQDTAPHTATSDTGAWDSGTLMTGKAFSFTFSQAGTFAYHCNIHPTMHGTVTVMGAGGASTTAPAASAAAPAPSAAAPSVVAPPRTGDGGGAAYIRRLGDG
jgi:plastocyanin